MKKILVILCSIIVLCSFKDNQGIDEVINGIKSGSASSVSKHFDNTVEISLSGKSNNYSKSQGEAVLRDFFANNAVKSFNVVHRGESGGAQYFIGTLVTSHGAYRTTVNLKKKGDKQMLQEMKFEH